MIDLEGYAKKGVQGRGGTRFEPVFDLLEKGIPDGQWPDVRELMPDDVVSVTFVTDLGGSFPAKEPPFETLWLTSETGKAPWGVTVRMEK